MNLTEKSSRVESDIFTRLQLTEPPVNSSLFKFNVHICLNSTVNLYKKKK